MDAGGSFHMSFDKLCNRSRMPSSGALVMTDVSEERNTSIIRVKRIRELGTTVAVTSVPTRATQRHITEHGYLQCDRHGNLKSYKSARSKVIFNEY
jgi:hypothetical protein